MQSSWQAGGIAEVNPVDGNSVPPLDTNGNVDCDAAGALLVLVPPIWLRFYGTAKLSLGHAESFPQCNKPFRNCSITVHGSTMEPSASTFYFHYVNEMET